MNNFLDICRHIGETVTIFTTSGGASGCGFTGILIVVNPNFVRLITRIGAPPANPLSENICGDLENGPARGRKGCGGQEDDFTLGSVCDIPICRIASICYNAV
jgi:hypothetical protein